MKYSRIQLVRAYVRLADTYSSADLAMGFASVLLRHRGKREIDAFSEDVVRVWGEAHDTAIATVTSARRLSSRARMRISSYVQHAEDTKHVRITYIVDSTLIGGATVQTSTRMYNFSVHGKLTKLL